MGENVNMLVKNIYFLKLYLNIFLFKLMIIEHKLNYTFTWMTA